VTGKPIHWPRLLVSQCLLGANVRYDGSHAANRYVIHTLAKRFQLIPFCPETGIGLSSPRDPIDLVRKGKKISAVTRDGNRTDVTARLARYSRKVLKENPGIHGIVLKSRSPSCAMADARISNGESIDNGPGIFAAMAAKLCQAPVIDERGLLNLSLRRKFLRILRMRPKTENRS